MSVGLAWPGLRITPFREVLHLFLLLVSGVFSSQSPLYLLIIQVFRFHFVFSSYVFLEFSCEFIYAFKRMVLIFYLIFQGFHCFLKFVVSQIEAPA